MYSYYYVTPAIKPPFKKTVKHTRGEFCGVTEPIGTFGFKYAIFRNRRSEVLIPLHDLTPETRAKIAAQAVTA